MLGSPFSTAGVVLALWVAGGGFVHAATPCEQLRGLALPHATVTAAAMSQAGAGIMACKIDVTSRPTSDSDIRIEVWIPAGAAWNGRYLQLGNGGFGGSLPLDPVPALEGYAVAGTDDGHQSTYPASASWARGHPEKVADYGWRALKETTDAAKTLIRAYRGAAPKFAYFNGCSDGGREALMEAQRFPNDFDGIVVGAPSNDLTGWLTLAAFEIQTLAAPGAYLTADSLKALESAALAACGGETYVADPARCRFDPRTVTCPQGENHPSCLTTAQAEAAFALYHGLAGPGGRVVYPGLTPGAEAEPGSWKSWITGPSLGEADKARLYRYSAGFFADFVGGAANQDILKVDVARASDETARLAKTLNATEADLRRFRAHGGKLIQYHGWNDPVIPARGSIAYYDSVHRSMGDVGDFYRLYLIPGMLHCDDGPGPGRVDWMGLIRDWAEDGKPPEAVVASSPGGQQTLCPWPQSASAMGAKGAQCVVRGRARN